MNPLVFGAASGVALIVALVVVRRQRNLPMRALTTFARTTTALELAVDDATSRRIIEAMESSLRARADAQSVVRTARHRSTAQRHFRAIDRRHEAAIVAARVAVDARAPNGHEASAT